MMFSTQDLLQLVKHISYGLRNLYRQSLFFKKCNLKPNNTGRWVLLSQLIKFSSQPARSALKLMIIIDVNVTSSSNVVSVTQDLLANPPGM